MRQISITIILLTVLTSCNKQNPQANATSSDDSFYKQYSTHQEEISKYIFRKNDGNYIIFYKDITAPSLNVLTVNSKGDTLSSRMIAHDTITDYMVIQLPSGGFMVSTIQTNFIYTISVDGELLKRVHIHNKDEFFMVISPPIPDAAGKYYVSKCIDGVITSSVFQYTICKVSPSGLVDTNYYKRTVYLSTLKFKPIDFRLCRVSENGDMYFTGTCIPSTSYSLFDEKKIFMMKADKAGKISFQYYNAGDNSLNERKIVKYVMLPDSGMLILANASPRISNNNFMQLIRTDKNMNQIWSNYYQLHNSSSTAKGFTLLKDGNIMLMGSTFGTPYTRPQPMMMKINSTSGNIIWDVIYNGRSAGETDDCYQLGNGYLLVTGSTNSFGYGKASGDIFLLKVPSNCKLY